MAQQPSSVSRRKALRLLGSGGAGFLFGSIAAKAKADRENGASTVSVGGQAAQMQIIPVSLQTLRISVLPLRGGAAEPIEPSVVLFPEHWPAPMAIYPSEARKDRLRWGARTVSVSCDPLQITVESSNGSSIQTIRIDSRSGAVHFRTSQCVVFGLGEGGKQFDRRGAAYAMKHGERVPDLRTDGARLLIPWILGTSGWALFFHLPFGSFDLTGKDGLFQPRAGKPCLPMDIFVVAADSPAEIMTEYARLTGFPHMPPRWALGYQQSHRTIDSRAEVMEEAETFRRKKLPCDVLIYLGTGFCPSGWNLGHGSFRFNPRVFPDPAEMINVFHNESFRIVLHDDKPPPHLHGQVTDTGAVAANPEDAAHYWREHLKVFDLGVDGWWADEGDRLDDISCLVRNRMHWEGAQQARPNIRPYTLNRNGYAGVQRYGWLWSGDIQSTWETLRDQIAVGLNTGLSGMPYWGTDTGGFFTTPELSGELYVRWFQFSTFCPLFRSHGRTWKLRLPWGWNTGSYGPIEDPVSALPPVQNLHNPEVEPICRKYLYLRYRLLPYLYTAVREAHDTGLPIMRALWLHYPEDRRAVEQGDEYLWGRDMLVAPVTQQSAASRTLYLPRGTWYDFWTEEKIEGGREITRPVDLATIPIYVRAGAILPFAPVKQFTVEASALPITLRIYPGTNGQAEFYEDDGLTFNFRHGGFARTRFAWDDDRRRLALTLVEGRMKYRHAKQFKVRVVPEPAGQILTFEGKFTTLQL
jgi:alpha-glucosidase (family GH31 glycosyl hydrolase)